MQEGMGLAILFLFVSGLTFLVMTRAARRRERTEERLGRSGAETETESTLLGELTPALAEQSSMSATAQADLQKELREAGYYRPTALMEYAAARMVLLFVPLAAGIVLSLLVPRERMPLMVVLGL